MGKNNNDYVAVYENGELVIKKKDANQPVKKKSNSKKHDYVAVVENGNVVLKEKPKNVVSVHAIGNKTVILKCIKKLYEIFNREHVISGGANNKQNKTFDTPYVPNSFVAISDFHGIKWPIEKIEKYYVNEYDKIFILGDAMDRGPDGVEILRNIKFLSEKYPGRVIYIPGNHDKFLYDYACYGDYTAEVNARHNHGSDTLDDIDELKRNNPSEFKSLIDWLGSRPLQVKHQFNGKEYALAHAFFNQKLYDYNKEYCLYDYYNESNEVFENYAFITLWFRKKQYSRDTFNSDLSCYPAEMIIGHTPRGLRGCDNLDLMDSNNNIIKVHCVDEGLVFNGDQMAKFDGGNRVKITTLYEHVNTAPRR